MRSIRTSALLWVGSLLRVGTRLTACGDRRRGAVGRPGSSRSRLGGLDPKLSVGRTEGGRSAKIGRRGSRPGSLQFSRPLPPSRVISSPGSPPSCRPLLDTPCTTSGLHEDGGDIAPPCNLIEPRRASPLPVAPRRQPNAEDAGRLWVLSGSVLPTKRGYATDLTVLYVRPIEKGEPMIKLRGCRAGRRVIQATCIFVVDGVANAASACRFEVLHSFRPTNNMLARPRGRLLEDRVALSMVLPRYVARTAKMVCCSPDRSPAPSWAPSIKSRLVQRQ